MLVLGPPSDTIRLTSDSAATIDIHVTWVDRQIFNSGSSYSDTPGRTNTQIGASASYTIVTAPLTTSSYKNVRQLIISNRDPSVDANIIVQHSGSTGPAARIFAAHLSSSWTVMFNDSAGWAMFDASGTRTDSTQVGLYLKTNVLTVSGQFVTSPRTNKIMISGVGAGAGGAGCTSVAAAASAGGGGGGGAYTEKTFSVTPSTSYTFTVGAAGTGNSGAAGGNGGNSTFVVGATTVTAPGGTGAPIATALTTVSTYRGGAGGIVATNGDLRSGGQPGRPGIISVVAVPSGSSGGGGSSPFGTGGAPIDVVGAGNAGIGFGAGGSGALTGASTVQTGGVGTGGCWIVDEYS